MSTPFEKHTLGFFQRDSARRHRLAELIKRSQEILDELETLHKEYKYPSTDLYNRIIDLSIAVYDLITPPSE